jgi:hypothetical protein
MAERFRAWMTPETRSRRILLGLAIYLGCLLVFSLVAGSRLARHTPGNHYALMAEAWLHGRHDLGGPPPAYTGMNDFAQYNGKWYISFPPFPSVLMLPIVWIAGSADNFKDGQFIVWLAGIGPAVLFLVFENLRRNGRSERTEVENVRLALLFAFGTVYFFTAVHGQVWYSAHIVGVGVSALFVLCALDAKHPLLAGLMLGFCFLTRPTTALIGLFFLFEAIRVSGSDRKKLVELLAASAFPFGLCLVFASWLNHARYDNWSPAAFGHEYLQIGWRGRIDKWGLFSVHFLPRNLAIMLAGIPWKVGEKLWVISGHGLALWFTTPIYLALARSRVDKLWLAAAAGAAGPLVMNLLYQNSGWFQFGYRFSNDYAVLLFVMLAVGLRRLGTPFWYAAVWCIGCNLLGAITFDHAWGDRPKFSGLYNHDASVLPND